MLTHSIKSNAKHKLDNNIKERIEKDKEHIRFPREELNKLVEMQVNKKINTALKSRKQKNSSRRDATTSKNHTTNSKNGANGENKQPKVTRKKKEEEANKTTQAQGPYNQHTIKKNTTTTKCG